MYTSALLCYKKGVHTVHTLATIQHILCVIVGNVVRDKEKENIVARSVDGVVKASSWQHGLVRESDVPSLGCGPVVRQE